MCVCRTCLSKRDLEPLFSHRNVFTFNNRDLFLVTGVEIKQNDGLSQVICKACINLINNALKLREQSAKANVVLQRKHATDKFSINVKIESKDLDITDCRVNVKNFLPSGTVQNFNDNSQNAYNTVKYKLLMDPQNIDKKRHQEDHRNLTDFIPGTSNSEINVNTKIGSKSNIKIDVLKTETMNKTPKTHSLQQPLCIEDLESTDSEKEASKIRIEDFESSDSFDDDMSMLCDNVTFKSSVFNLDKLGKRVVLMDDKKYMNYYKHVTEKKKNPKVKHKTAIKEQDKKIMALAVTPYEKNGPIQCHVCYSTVRGLASFKTHAKTHFDPQFSCETCGKKFRSNSHMRYHQQRMHGQTKRLACMYCPYRSVDRQTLRNHERAEHTGERPYTCDECGVSFRMRNNLIQHLRKHFGVKNMQCERCPAMFRSRSELWGHQTKVHFMTYNYYCYLCPESYKGPGPVKKHLLNVHGVPEDQQLKIKCVKTRKIREDQLPYKTRLKNIS